jgi:hypothetical protein
VERIQRQVHGRDSGRCLAQLRKCEIDGDGMGRPAKAKHHSDGAIGYSDGSIRSEQLGVAEPRYFLDLPGATRPSGPKGHCSIQSSWFVVSRVVTCVTVRVIALA